MRFSRRSKTKEMMSHIYHLPYNRQTERQTDRQTDIQMQPMSDNA